MDTLDEIEKRWHSVECYMGQALDVTTPRQFGYFNQKAWLEFQEIKRLFRTMALPANRSTAVVTSVPAANAHNDF